MLNELNKNHMSGVDNNGADSFYDLGDAWDRPNFPVKPIKVSINNLHYSENSKIELISFFLNLASATAGLCQRHQDERQ